MTDPRKVLIPDASLHASATKFTPIPLGVGITTRSWIFPRLFMCAAAVTARPKSSTLGIARTRARPPRGARG